MTDDYLDEFLEGWASNQCCFCASVRTVSREAALATFPPISVPLHINLPSCPYTHVKIGGKIYKRVVEDEKTCEYFSELPEYCHDCSIRFGTGAHHLGCDVETCPVPQCGGQFIGCDHGQQRYFMGLDDKIGKDVPPPESAEDYFTRKYSEDREEGLRVFIEYHLHQRELPLDDIKEMAKDFDEEYGGGCSCGSGHSMIPFEDIWNDSISFVAKSSAALEEYNKQRPSVSSSSIRPTKWSELKIKDKRDLK
jgi:hypothetical protein